MNLVALLIAPVVVKYGVGNDKNLLVRAIIAIIAIAGITLAVRASSRRSVADAVQGAAAPIETPARTPVG
jgi:K(+)-stimulated pyrophosphate-energized sodium pump